MKPVVIGESALPFGANFDRLPFQRMDWFCAPTTKLLPTQALPLAVDHQLAAAADAAAGELQRKHPRARREGEIGHEGRSAHLLAVRHRIERIQQGEDLVRLMRRIPGDGLGGRQCVGGHHAGRRGRRSEELGAGIGSDLRGATGEQVASVAKFAMVGVWRAVQRVLNRRAPAAGREIDKVGHVARGDAQRERRTLDCRAVDELIVRQHRGDGGELVDRDLGRRRAAEHRHQRNGRVVPGGLVGGRLPTLCDQVEAGIGRGFRRSQCEAAIGASAYLP